MKSVRIIVENPTVTSSTPSLPQTGDATPLALLACIAVLSVTGLYVIKRRSA